VNRVQAARAARLGYVNRPRLALDGNERETIGAAPSVEALDAARDLSAALKTAVAALAIAMPWAVSL